MQILDPPLQCMDSIISLWLYCAESHLRTVSFSGVTENERHFWVKQNVIWVGMKII